MDDVISVAVVERLDDLAEDACCVVLTEELVLDDAIEKLTTRAKSIGENKSKLGKVRAHVRGEEAINVRENDLLSDKVNVRIVLEVFVELDDVWVILNTQSTQPKA